jgi:hypothetical protein
VEIHNIDVYVFFFMSRGDVGEREEGRWFSRKKETFKF